MCKWGKSFEISFHDCSAGFLTPLHTASTSGSWLPRTSCPAQLQTEEDSQFCLFPVLLEWPNFSPPPKQPYIVLYAIWTLFNSLYPTFVIQYCGWAILEHNRQIVSKAVTLLQAQVTIMATYRQITPNSGHLKSRLQYSEIHAFLSKTLKKCSVVLMGLIPTYCTATGCKFYFLRCGVCLGRPC